MGHYVVGFIDDDRTKLDSVVDSRDCRVIMTLQDLIEHQAREDSLPFHVDRIALGIGDNRRRLEVFLQLQKFCTALVHPTAAVSPTVRLGAGSVVFATAAINAEARLGVAAIVNTGAIIEHDCVLGDAVHVSPGAVLCGNVTVGDRTWIGAGAVVIQGRTVGKGSIVGAGSVVVRDIPDDVVAYGNPARIQTAVSAEH
jgi:sugar O-acyltransferase (sialic acid O-acetyltransferase NeuD family)